MKAMYLAAIALVMLAIGACLLFGTIGWFAVGFGVMTDCTDSYSSSPTGFSPCTTAGLWINAGALAQQLLAAAGVGVLIRGLRTRESGRLASCGAVLLVSSVLIMVGTTWLAEGSYCPAGRSLVVGRVVATHLACRREVAAQVGADSRYARSGQGEPGPGVVPSPLAGDPRRCVDADGEPVGDRVDESDALVA
jgi:hypothetical protein